MVGEFPSTHEAPAAGLSAWTEPDGSQQPVRTIDARVRMLVLQLRGDWAQIECSNGWRAWVDARKLVSTHAVSPSAVPPPPASTVGTAASFGATHRVPPGGTRAWDRPDSTRPPAATLGAELPVKLLEHRPNGWAQVECSNGWKSWVDGGVLLAGSTDTETPLRRGQSSWSLVFERIAIGPLALGGAAAVILGSFLPWLSLGPESVNAWDLGLAAVIRGSGSPSGMKVGLALMVVVLVGLPLVTRKGMPAIGVAALGGVANTLAVLVFLQNGRAEFSVDPGIGLLLVFGGGSAILAEFAIALQRLDKGRA